MAIGGTTFRLGGKDRDKAYRANYAASDVFIVAKLIIPWILLYSPSVSSALVFWLCFGFVVETVLCVLGNGFVPGEGRALYR